MPSKPVSFIVRMNVPSPFPVDMLRYDSCYPATTMDALAMSLAIKDQQEYSHLYDVPNGIHLYGAKATPERWLSFGWEVFAR